MLVIFSDVLLQQPSVLVFFHIAYRFLVLSDGTKTSFGFRIFAMSVLIFFWTSSLTSLNSRLPMRLNMSAMKAFISSACGGDFRFFRPYFSPWQSASFSLSCSSPRRRKKNAFCLILLITLSTISMSFFWQVSTAGIGMFFQEYGKSNFRSVAMSVLVSFLFRSYSVLARSRCRNVSSWYRSCKSRIGQKESAQLKGAKLSNYKDESGCLQKSAQPAKAGGGCVVFAKMPLYFFHGAKKSKMTKTQIKPVGPALLNLIKRIS